MYALKSILVPFKHVLYLRVQIVKGNVKNASFGKRVKMTVPPQPREKIEEETLQTS